MAFMILGIALLAMKLAEFGPVAAWSWGWVLAPFGLALLWWALSDKLGLTQRRAMDKMEERKIERRNRNLVALGLGPARNVKARRDSRLPAGAAGKHASRTRSPRPRMPGAEAARPRYQANLSSTAPLLALDALCANLASTPRV